MTDGTEEPQSFEKGDRVAVMRLAPLTGEIQIVAATVVGMIDEYQAVIRFAGNEKEFLAGWRPDANAAAVMPPEDTLHP